MKSSKKNSVSFNAFNLDKKIKGVYWIIKATNKTITAVMSFILVLICCSTTHALEFTVSSASQFNSLNLSPGDIVTWANGSYSANQKINFLANGTSSNPIILKAETPGGVVFTGETTMDISGNFVIIEGFYWNGGAGTNNHIQFRKGTNYANNSTIRNCAFNNLTPEGTAKHRWIVLYGKNNTIENCSFLNKNSPGALVLVELEYNDLNPVGHRIVNNYFYNFTKRQSGTTHAGDSETIRVGTSEYQNKSASTIVAGNYFFKSDGENEIITNKSAGNTYKNNTFRRCRGSLVLRHGARATVNGNFFLGENVEGTGGIRISDSFHVITNNYIQNVISTGDKWNNPITLVGGSATSGGTSNGYQKVDDILIAFNSIYNSDSPIYYNDRSSYDPRGVLAYNAIHTTKSNIVTGDISGTGQGMQYTGNIAGGSAIGISNTGIINGNANFSVSGEIFKPSSSGPVANAAGSNYSATVNFDVEGRTRPNSNMDVGAHEVSGGGGNAVFAPFTNNQVGTVIGACFLNATGASINACSTNNTETLSITSVSEFTAEAGSKTALISSNVNWTVSDNSSWINASPVSGSNNGSITITVLANTSSTTRTGVVTVSGGALTRTITITQVGASTPPNPTLSIPGRLQAEDFSSQNGIQTENTRDTGGGTNVGYIDTNDYMDYTVNVATAGTYTVSFRVASLSNTMNFQLRKGSTVLSTISTATTNGWQNWKTITSTADLIAGDQTLRVFATGGGWNINWLDFTLNTTPTNVAVTGVTLTPSNLALTTGETQQLSATVSPSNASNKNISYTSNNPAIATVNTNGLIKAISVGSTTIIVTTADGNFTDTTMVRVSASNSALQIPGRIQAEDFSTQNGIQTENTGDAGGGTNVGYIDTNDYMDYTVDVATSGTYTVAFRVASSSNTMNFQLRNGTTVLTTISTPTTNGWQNWKTVTGTANLSAGNQTLRILATGGGWNINWLDFVLNTTPTTPSCTTGANIAASGSIVNVSTEQTTNPASHLLDGNTSNRWSANTFPQSVVIDLGDTYNVNQIKLHSYKNRAYQFLVESSTSSANSGFSVLTDARGNTTGGSIITKNITTKQARYVKLTITGASGYTGSWVSIREFEVICAGGSTTSKASVTPSLSNTEELKNITYYPNPFTSHLKVDFTSQDLKLVSSLRLVNSLGSVLLEKNNIKKINTFYLSQSLPKGLYILQVINTEGLLLMSKKVIKK